MAEDAEDDEAAGGPPHPLDRVWFHPSELSAYMATSPERRGGREWGFAAMAALFGAVATAAVLALSGAFDGGTTNVSQFRLGAVAGAAGDVAEVVARARPSVVEVSVQTLGGPVDGSGVVVGRAEVLTSASLLVGASGALMVSTPDGRVLSASAVGTDPDTDLALLRVDLNKGGDLSPARLGSADALVVGQTVVALGMTGGDHPWTSRGVVNALDRLFTTPSGTLMAGLIETDVRPGDVVGGGALLDASGAVVGILTRAAPGHALPIDVARDVASQLTNGGMAHHGWLGAEVVDASDRPGGGARVGSVTPDGPAAKAGIAPGDVIVSVGSELVTDRADLLAAVSRRRSADTVGVTFWRATKRLRRDVQLGAPYPVAPKVG